MGSSIALNAADHGIEVIGTSQKIHDPQALEKASVQIVDDIPAVISKLRSPRVIFLHVPAGPVVDTVIESIVPLLEKGDVLVDAGNSHFKDSAVRQARLAEIKIGFIDCGSSGGAGGARTGGCFMIGGTFSDVAKVEPLLRALSVSEGYLHAGPPGAGHYVKLIHNAIEFGMLQAIGEGVALLKSSDYPIDFPALFHNWAHGSVIRGWLVELMERGFRENPDLEKIPSHVEDTGEVSWAVQEALNREVSTPVISAAVQELFASRDSKQFSHRAIAVMRHGFGGHPYGHDAGIAQERRTGQVGLTQARPHSDGSAAKVNAPAVDFNQIKRR